MNIPFATKEFFQVFEAYDLAIWPAQVAAYVLGIIAIWSVFSKSELSDRLASGILAAFWIWIGVFYHILHFAAINRAAYVFGLLFVVQGILFIAAGVIYKKLSFRAVRSVRFVAGACIVVYALAMYQLLGMAA